MVVRYHHDATWRSPHIKFSCKVPNRWSAGELFQRGVNSLEGGSSEISDRGQIKLRLVLLGSVYREPVN